MHGSHSDAIKTQQKARYDLVGVLGWLELVLLGIRELAEQYYMILSTNESQASTGLDQWEWTILTTGLISLHSFQYDLALEMFEKAAATEQSETGRRFPMAMWGAAMATTQILWQNSDCEKGKKYLEKISTEAEWITEKEKAYIETGFALYPKSLTCAKDKNQNTRESRFMKAMKKLTRKYPEETEALAFWAVSGKSLYSSLNPYLSSIATAYPL